MVVNSGVADVRAARRRENATVSAPVSAMQKRKRLGKSRFGCCGSLKLAGELNPATEKAALAGSASRVLR